jgi:minor extracellular serine protease Vpr
MTRLTAVIALFVFAAFGQSQSRTADYAIILEDAPVARMTASRADLFGAAGRAHLIKVESAQQSVLSELAMRRIPVTYSSQLLLNAIFISTDRDTAASLRGLPGVKAIVYTPPLKPTLYTALDQVGARTAWGSVGGESGAGAGIKIGIIDSGIDQNHPGLQDASLTVPAGFPKGDSNFTNKKVIVARSFLQQTPYPDPDSRNTAPDDLSPRDHEGHGTAIAMIAAGVRNMGPNGAITGVAPKAYLGNYRVMGSPGVNLAKAAGVIAALTAALQDGMDIVTVAYSEGDMWDTGPLDIDKTFCSGDPNGVCDTIATAVENAVSNGLVVLTAAGNDGNLASRSTPTLNTIHSPGTAPSAITVGAVTNSHELYQSVKATAPNPPSNLQNIKALFSDGPQIQTAFNAPLRDVSALGTNGLACSALPAGSLNGAVALVQRGTCAYSDKVNNAQNAGAIAVIVYQSPVNETPIHDWFAQDTGVPAIMIGYSDGVGLRGWANSNPTARVTLDPAFTEYGSTKDVVAAFSSRGPAIGTLGIKPELVAPGAGVYTAAQNYDPSGSIYHASRYSVVNGTSMAVGFAAGAAALVKQKNPNLTPAQIKSLLVNTANADVNSDVSPARVTDMGAGELNVTAAVNGGTAFNPAAISFGAVASGSLPINITLGISNVSGAAQTIALSVVLDARFTTSAASVRLSASTVTLSAGASTNITVTLQGTIPAAGSYQGYIAATVGSTTYRIPYLFMVSDGILDSAFPIRSPGIDRVGGTDWYMEIKAIDKAGLPLIGVPVQWSVVSGGGAVRLYDAQTAKHGVAGAIVNYGNTVGDQVFRAVVGLGGSAIPIDFYGYARPLQTIFTGGVVDAASYRLLQSPKGYAPGSYISIFGNNLSPALQGFSTGYLPYALSTVSVGFYTSSGKRVPARVAYVSGPQINVLIPWELAGETSTQMVIRVGYIPSASYTIPLATYSPGVFQYYLGGQFYAVILDSAGAVVGPANPARRGQNIHIYANGLGPVSNPPASGEASPVSPPAGLTSSLALTIGGKAASYTFAGLDPGNIGVYRIDATVPADSATGVQTVAISVDGVNSLTATAPVQ